MNKDKIIKDLKERNNKLENQRRQFELNYYHEQHIVEEKDKEIERLNNIIDLVVKDMEMTKYNPELPTYNSCVAVDKDHIQQWIDKLNSLKESKDSNDKFTNK